MDLARHRLACPRRQALAGLAGSLLAPTWAQHAPQGEGKAPPPPQPGRKFALPDVPLLDGTTFAGTEADGRVPLLYGWASGCRFCAQRSPLMDKFWLTHKGRGLHMLDRAVASTSKENPR